MNSRGIFSVVFLVIFLQLWSQGEGKFRIVAGRKASAMEFPYQVEIERMTLHWCGGSIIHKNYVLTAAHCVKAYEDLSPVPPYVLRLRVGNDVSGTGGSTHAIDQIMPHEDYLDQAETDQYDIALIKVAKPFKFNDKVKLIKLVTKKPKAGAMGWISGFGKQEVMRSASSGKRHLMAVELPVIDLEECRKKLPKVADDMICAGFKKGHKDSCTGDSGGPLVVDNELAGVVAWGIGCGREGMPGVYTNVAWYRKWIDSHMKNGKKEKKQESAEEEE